MNVTDIAIDSLAPAAWNSNTMDSSMLAKLRKSVETFGFLEPLVVREGKDGQFEVIGGSHRLRVLRESGADTAPCVVVEADDTRAMLLSQALNHIEGEEDPARRGASLRRILDAFSVEDVLSYLPETSDSLAALTDLGRQTPEEYLRSWNIRKAARLNHLTFQLTVGQLGTVEKAIELALQAMGRDSGNPNQRGNALTWMCEQFINSQEPL